MEPAKIAYIFKLFLGDIFVYTLTSKMDRFVVKTNITPAILFSCLRNIIYFKGEDILKT